MYGTSSHVITPSCVILASGVARQKRQSKLGLWNSLCTTEPILLEVIKWVSKVHYAHIQIDDEVTSNIVYWALKSRTGSVDAYPIPCNPQFQLQQTNSRSWRDVTRLSNKRSPYLFGVATANRTKVTTPNKYGAEIIARMSDWENHSQDLWHQVDLPSSLPDALCDLWDGSTRFLVCLSMGIESVPSFRPFPT